MTHLVGLVNSGIEAASGCDVSNRRSIDGVEGQRFGGDQRELKIRVVQRVACRLEESDLMFR